MIELRPHHIFCLLNFEGKGYTPKFVENMSDLAHRVEEGEEIKIVTGPDDICAPLCNSHHWHCEKASVTKRDEAALRYLPWKTGESFVFSKEIRADMKAQYREGFYRKVCKGCEWEELCAHL